MTFSWSSNLESRALSFAGTHVHHGPPGFVVDALFRIPLRKAGRASGVSLSSASDVAAGTFLLALPPSQSRANRRPRSRASLAPLGTGTADFIPGAERPTPPVSETKR